MRLRVEASPGRQTAHLGYLWVERVTIDLL
jgi:hypothetical protein